MFLFAVIPLVKIIDISVVVHELELAINVTYWVFCEIQVIRSM